jgi:hypothetical protein
LLEVAVEPVPQAVEAILGTQVGILKRVLSLWQVL